MANKYIDTSATYNGDGTASNQAASAGAPGAWNSFQNVLIGTPGYGSVAAGDVIYVRTKNGANNLSETSTSTAIITSTTIGTESSPVIFVFDAGSVWVGDSGTFTWSTGASANARVVWNSNLIFLATEYNFVVTNGYTGGTNVYGWLQFRRARFENVKFVTVAGSNTQFTQGGGVQYHSTFIAPIFDINSAPSGSTSLFLLEEESRMEMLDPTFNLNNIAFPAPIFSAYLPSYGHTTLDIRGGRIINCQTSNTLMNVYNRCNAPGTLDTR